MSTPAPAVRVLLVDDEAAVRATLADLLADAPQVDVVGELDDGASVCAAIESTRPDVVLMDLRMPRTDGITATRAVRELRDPPAVLVLTVFESDHDVRSALAAGAAGYLVKHAPPEHIEAAIEQVAAGQPVLSPSVTRRLIHTVVSTDEQDRARRRRAAEVLATLTDQERAIATAVGQGHSNARIAAEMFLSLSTVKTHVSHAMSKLGLDNRTQLALLLRGDPARRGAPHSNDREEST
jgi:DNA-binding NarL/FixJ family response regulator